MTGDSILCIFATKNHKNNPIMKTKSFLSFLPGVSAYIVGGLASLALAGGLSSCTFDDTDLQNSIET